MQEAGAFAVLMEMVPGDVAARATRSWRSPTIGGGQVLVWRDAFGLNTGRLPRFVKQYADLHGVLLDAARSDAADVKDGSFLAPSTPSEPVLADALTGARRFAKGAGPLGAPAPA